MFGYLTLGLGGERKVAKEGLVEGLNWEYIRKFAKLKVWWEIDGWWSWESLETEREQNDKFCGRFELECTIRNKLSKSQVKKVGENKVWVGFLLTCHVSFNSFYGFHFFFFGGRNCLKK